MILPHVAQLNASKRIVLASGSPRRRELLNVLGLNKFEVCLSQAQCAAPATLVNPSHHTRRVLTQHNPPTRPVGLHADNCQHL